MVIAWDWQGFEMDVMAEEEEEEDKYIKRFERWKEKFKVERSVQSTEWISWVCVRVRNRKESLEEKKMSLGMKVSMDMGI